MTQSDHPELESALREALRPVEPRAGFETRVMHALDASRRQRYRPPLWGFASAAAAIFALVAVGALSYREHAQALRAEQTRAQVLEALRITNDKLDTAFRLLADETRNDRDGDDRQFN